MMLTQKLKKKELWCNRNLSIKSVILKKLDFSSSSDELDLFYNQLKIISSKKFNISQHNFKFVQK